MTGTIGRHGLFQLSGHAPCIPFFLVPFPKRKRLSQVKKTTAVLKRAMTEKRERWEGREWPRKTKVPMATADRGVVGSSSHDTWDISQSKGVWREISSEMDAVADHCDRKVKYVEQKL